MAEKKLLSDEQSFFDVIQHASASPDSHNRICVEGIGLNYSPTLDFNKEPFSACRTKTVLFRDCHFPYTTTLWCPMEYPLVPLGDIAERTVLFERCELGILNAYGDTNVILTESNASAVCAELRERNVFVSSRGTFSSLSLKGSMMGAGFVHTKTTLLYLELENRNFRFWRRSAAGGGRFCIDRHPHQVWDPDFSLHIARYILSSRRANIQMFRDLCPRTKAIHLSQLGDFE